MKQTDKSSHILNTSSTLLGLCFIVLTSLKVNNHTEATLIDEFTAVAIVAFMASSILSFLSMRNNKAPSERYERFADIMFMVGLSALFVTTVLIVFNVVK